MGAGKSGGAIGQMDGVKSMNNPFTLTRVAALPGGVLHLTYADGQTFDVDVTPVIEHAPVLAALARPEVFSRAKLGPWGSSVCWDEDENLELAADNLRARAIEQQGGHSHEHLVEWMHRHALTPQTAADAIGIASHVLDDYLSGTKPVPRTVALACLGWQAARQVAA